MPFDTNTLCRYRIERAEEDLLTAESNHQAGFYKAAINRSYYAIFHSIRAINILDGFDASKHSSVIAHGFEGGLRSTVKQCKNVSSYSESIFKKEGIGKLEKKMKCCGRG